VVTLSLLLATSPEVTGYSLFHPETKDKKSNKSCLPSEMFTPWNFVVDKSEVNNKA
jgi:hypothetical protein